MEQRLFILLILTGFLDPGLSIGRNYKLIQTPKTWADARTYCRANYTDLATIQTSTELTRLQIKARNNLLSSSAWIGLYRPWRWTISNEPLGNVTFWASGEPAPIDNNIECAGLSPSKGVWTDYQCYMFKPYVCYDGNNPSASRYVYYSSPQTWYTAQRFCRQFHTELANPMNATEHAFIRTVITAEAWIGLIRDNWRWSDSFNGPSIGFSGQVDNAQLEENCMYLINSQVFDDLCTKLMPFFCYLAVPVQMQQIVRLNVQSDQDMNHTQVEAQILEQIHTTLNAQGMVNVTVKFKIQSDGMVFLKDGNL